MQTLTQKEKDHIDKNYPGTYDDIIEYGTNPLNEKYYYIIQYIMV